jgi:OHCU decarboxylase
LKEEVKHSNMPGGLERLNCLSQEAATAELLNCCGSRNWARQMSEQRPFRHLRALTESADRIWWSLDRQDWLEAFCSHPKIGESKKGVIASQSVKEQQSVKERQSMDARKESLSNKWSEGEQSGARVASQEVMNALAEANRTYKSKFGYIFIVCATRKTAEEMLSLLEQRLHNDADTELRVAAEEQTRITHLRLEKLLNI